MNKYKEIYGIDISKDVFDVYGSQSGHHQFKNDSRGFLKFKNTLSSGSLVVMEATGYYHYRLAQYLHQEGGVGFCSQSFIGKAFYPDEAC